MEVKVLREAGYEEAALGFSLSYNSTPERAKVLFPRFAFARPGENKFLESIQIWLDVNAPRFFWSEFDTYRVGVTKQSESSMHTLTKTKLTHSHFENGLTDFMISYLNDMILKYNCGACKIDEVKGVLPEGFLQRRIVNLNYKTLQNIYNQRKYHRLPQWHYFLDTVLAQIEHPEFIVQKLEAETE